MLIITRRQGESFFIGPDVKVTILKDRFEKIRVGIEAPREVQILREEVAKRYGLVDRFGKWIGNVKQKIKPTGAFINTQ